MRRGIGLDVHREFAEGGRVGCDCGARSCTREQAPPAVFVWDLILNAMRAPRAEPAVSSTAVRSCGTGWVRHKFAGLAPITHQALEPLRRPLVHAFAARGSP
jgi:hypothetical protein